MTLGEGGTGGTPLLAATRLEPAGTLLLKNEAANPTLSFKDRGVSVAATMAREQIERANLALDRLTMPAPLVSSAA